MPIEQLRDELNDEVSAIFDAGFTINITETTTVPRPDDPAITFPNLDTRTQGAKLITTCVLYIDMRKSTDLSLAHRQQTVAKLYTTFVRAMTRTARYYGGHVRGIIGDRVMVLFDAANCYKDAVHCAIAMNTIARHLINRHFKANEVLFGIGIDYGRMLATKTGIRRHGAEQSSYRSLVWLGRPANVASKLTDIANKPAEHRAEDRVRVAYDRPVGIGAFGLFGALSQQSPNPLLNLGIGVNSGSTEWQWVSETLPAFISQLEVNYVPSRINHKRSDFGSFYLSTDYVETKPATPSILMTKSVWLGFKRAQPESNMVKQLMFKKVDVTVPGYTDHVYGGSIEFPSLRP